MTTIYDVDILLVDDNPDLLALVADNLHTAGYKTVRTAASCADAKTAFARRRFWTSTCPTATASGCSATCTQDPMCRRCFSRPGMPTPIGCSA